MKHTRLFNGLTVPGQMTNWVLTLAVLCLPLLTQAQTLQSVSGKVLDDTGTPLPGATVVVIGTTTGTVTDIEGTYSLEAPLNSTIQVSFIGYASQSFEFTGQSEMDINLRVDATEMEEVIVVGYGTVQKSDLTGSVATVDMKQMKKFASVDVRQNLQGSVAGVQVTSNSAAPGSGGTSIRVRGVGSMANADPLFVVDGFITNDLSNIVPSDIVSMEVLKDASATAIYGSRGANGVVLVTTKRAEEGKFSVNLNSYYGIQELTNRYDVLDAQGYARAYLVSRYGEEGTIENLANGPLRDWISGALDGTLQGTDWQDEITRSAAIHNTELSISGGKEKFAYKLGGLFFSQEGTLVNTYSDRIQLNGAVVVKPLKWLTLDASVRYSINEYLQYNAGTYSSIMATAVRKDPLASPRVPSAMDLFNDSRVTDIMSPSLAAFTQRGDISQEQRINTNLKLTIDISPAIKFNSVFAYDQKDIDRVSDTPEYYSANQFDLYNADNSYRYLPNATNDSAFSWTDVDQVVVIQTSNYFNFNKAFGNHSIGVDVGMEYYRNELDNTPGREIVTENDRAFTLLSGFARGSYGYDRRYMATATIRRDGSSKFHEDYRWGNFSSFSLAWNVDNEAFFPKNPILSGLKLRGGWGQIGNSDAVAPYRFLAVLSTGEVYSFDNVSGSPGMAALKLPATSLQWETSEMLNAGIDLLLFQDKVSFTAEYFIKDTRDLLVENPPSPNFAGALGPASNAASMQNRGIELSLDYKHVFGDWTVNVGGNISFIENEVTSLGAIDGEAVNYIPGGQDESKINLPATRTVKGMEFATYYGYQIIGVFQSDDEADAYRAVNESGQPIDIQGNVLNNVDPNTYVGTTSEGEESEQALLQRRAGAGDYIYQDTNFDGRIDEFDAVPLGSAIPDFTYGAYLSASYKQFDLSVMISGTYGNEAANVFKYYTEGTSATLNNITKARFENRWTATNPNNTTAILSSSANAANDNFSSRYVEDASFMRIRNVQLGYTMPEALLNKLKLQQWRVYLSVDNLATFTKYSGLDPEVGGRSSDPFSPGVDYFNYPLGRTIFLGTNITF